MKLTIIPISITVVLTLLCKPSFSQHEISVSGGLEVPMANLTWVYKPTVSYNLSYYKMKHTWKALKMGAGLNVGLYTFKSSNEVLDYTTLNGGEGQGGFSDLSMLMLSGSLRWTYEVDDLLEPYFGFDLGYYYSKYEYDLNDPDQTTHGTNIEGKFAVAPKVGLGFNVSDNLGFFVQTRYNVCLRINSDGASASNGIGSAPSSDGEYNGQSDFGRVTTIWSTNVGVYCRFGR